VLPGVVDAVGHGLLGFVWSENPFTRRYRQLDADPAAARDVDWVSGCAIWLRRDALDAIGGWDERYFMYVEDVDLCARLRGSGYRVRYEPAGHVEHVQGASTARRPYRMIVEHHRSLWRFARVRFTGWRVALLPFAGAYLAVRALLALVDHAARTMLRTRSGTSRSTDGASTPEQGTPQTTG
jgi:N-acetylglucosaminyl-diphospho-decaprenol L-rhamnosyltransferase